MNKTKIYTIIFWASLIAILIWLILKVVGLISTPTIIEMFPYFGAVFGAGAFFQLVMDTKEQVSILKRRVDNIARGLTKLEIEFHSAYAKNKLE